MQTRQIGIGSGFTYVAEIETPVVFHIQPRSADEITLTGAQLDADPAMALHAYTDLYGNPCVRAVLPAGRSLVQYAAVATVPDATEDADPGAPEIPAAGLPPGYQRVQAICDYVHDHLTFAYGSTTATSTAADVFESGRGVCRDFTHLAISFCRALNIPARYVFGYLPDMDVPPDPAPMDFAAWMEVWLGDRWWTFDPRNNTVRKGRIVIGRGRDASDVATATTFGGPVLEQMTVVAEEVPA